jgi:hypothetical protein
MPRVASILCLVSLGVLASCSQFDTRWNSTAAPVSANPAAPVAGKWEGTWESDANDYWGHIQALIVPTTITVQDKVQVQQYAATFKFYFFNVGFDEYSVTLNAAKLPDGRLHFEGEKDLGYLKGGIVHFDGFLTGNNDVFYCDYNSNTQVGTFKLERIVLEKQ